MTEKQIDRALNLVERVVKVMEKWAEREFPLADEEPVEATISRVGDRPLPQSIEEYKTFEPDAQGKRSNRF